MGGGSRMLAAHDLRRRWVATVAITLLIGVVGAIVIATVAGARRSDNALRRFNDESRSADLEMDVGLPTAQQLRAFEAAAGSPIVGLIHAYGMSPKNRSNVAMGTSVDGTFGNTVDRSRVIRGRLANPNAVDEVTISESLAQQTGLTVGRDFETVSLSTEQFARGDFNNPEGPTPRLRVVGIVRRPADLSDIAASGGILALTPAFDREYHGKIALFTLALRVRTVGGATDAERVSDLARKTFGSSESFRITDIAAENNGGQHAIDVLTAALWIFAVVAAGAGFFAIGVVIFREMSHGRPQQPTLRSMGMTRSNRVAATLPRSMVMAIAGALIAVVGAIALSPLFPFGIARRADPDPGLHADWFALALGAAAVVIFVLGVAVAAGVRATRVDAGAHARRRRSTSDALGVSRLSPSVANGVRMALDPGRDERAVPVRSAFAGTVLGVLGVTAVLVFAASLSNLANTPRLYGWTWDMKARDIGSQAHCDRETSAIERQPGVSDIAAICYRGFEIDGRETVVWGFTQVRGSIEPTIVAGRVPSGDDEIALGLETMNALHKHIGDSVRVQGSATHEFRVVGRTVFPPMTYGDVQHLADGATVTGVGFASVHTTDDGETTRYVVARVAPNAIATVERDVRTAAIKQGGDPSLAGEAVGGATRPPEIDRIRHVAWFLPTLAILMCLLALVAVAHVLITAARRRRHELAVLKALGFRRAQVRATLAWEATTLAVVGLVIGIPAGVIVGRFAWSLVAGNIGVATTIALPVLALALLVPGALLLVNAVAYFPARAAARTRTSVALAAE